MSATCTNHFRYLEVMARIGVFVLLFVVVSMDTADFSYGSKIGILLYIFTMVLYLL